MSHTKDKRKDFDHTLYTGTLGGCGPGIGKRTQGDWEGEGTWELYWASAEVWNCGAMSGEKAPSRVKEFGRGKG